MVNFKKNRNMKKIIGSFILILVANVSSIFSQNQSTDYDPHTLFSPIFYTHNGNSYRTASGAPGPDYWQNSVNYKIKATLDAEKNQLKGTIHIDYTNNSPDDLSYVWVHLDQNLFRKDSRGNLMVPEKGSRFGSKDDFTEGFSLSNFQVKSGKKEYKKGEVTGLISTKKSDPTYTVLQEDTRLQVKLSSPITAKGGKLSLDIDFEFTLPQNGSDRMGYMTAKNGKIFSLAQWFPRMAVYDDVIGWNANPYLGAGEFYLEYGNIDYDITVPEDLIVLGSGELTNAEDVLSPRIYKKWEKAKKSDTKVEIISEIDVPTFDSANYTVPRRTKTWKYSIKNARDAAWSASRAFTLDGAKINLPSGKTALALSAQPKESHSNLAYGRGWEYVKNSVEFYSKMLYEYPYPMAINIASNQLGMEYPGIVFCSWKTTGAGVWGVIDHEFGHGWFPMIVGSNEKKYGWMDEGFNTFINELSGRNFNNGEFKASSALPTSLAAKRLAEKSSEYVMLQPDGIKERNIGLQLYYKPGIGLKLLREEILGEERFDYAFRTYIKNWAFKHPTPSDFFRSIENAAGEDLSWFWRSWFIKDYTLDQAIKDVKRKDSTWTVEIVNLKRMAMPVHLTATTLSGKKIVRKQAVDVWMRNSIWEINIPSEEEIVKIELDAENKFPDIDRDNNLWKKIIPSK